MLLDGSATFMVLSSIIIQQTATIMKSAEKSTVRGIRFSNTLWAALKKAAAENGRTIRGEIVFRLTKSKDLVN
jgi:hypothetical protein